jgi:predicted permease
MPSDAAYAVRQLRKSPAFTATAVLTLALAIGANTAIYQVLDAVLFRPLPVREPARLVQLHITEDGRTRSLTYSEFVELSKAAPVEGMIAVSDFPLHQAILRGRGQAHPVNTVIVSANYFGLLGVDARLGRIFTAADDREMVAVISDAFWQREFGRSRSAIGQPLHINKSVLTVIGVANARFAGETPGNPPDVWVPMGLTPQLLASDWRSTLRSWLAVIARLRPGVSLADAERAFGGNVRVQAAVHGVEGPIAKFADPSAILMGAVGLLLIIACSNLATLLLGRAAARAHEVGVRLALGASRGRIVRQLLAESAVLSLTGAILGVLAAYWAAGALTRVSGVAVEWNWRVLAFTASATVLATLLFGLAPARAAVRFERGPGRHTFARVLIAVQTAIALLLLSGAGLLSRSLSNLRGQDFGYRPDGMVIADLPWEFSPGSMARYAALEQPLLDRMSAIPGVTSAALVGFGPMGPAVHSGRIRVPGQAEIGIRMVHVSPRYFETAGIAIRSGRGLAEDDRASSKRVGVLTQTAARTLFGGENPVGRTVWLSPDTIEVVGVCSDLRFGGPTEAFTGAIFVPLTQSPVPITTALVRSAPNAGGVAGNLRAALRAADADQAVAYVRPATEVVDSMLGEQRLLALLSMGFGALGVVLACVGVYGVISYAVERRTREIGIRIAIGARRAQVTRLLAGEVAAVAVTGMVVGAAANLWIAPALRSVLFGIAPNDRATLVGAALVLGMVVAAAAYVPARRAARLDPTRALRVD